MHIFNKSGLDIEISIVNQEGKDIKSGVKIAVDKDENIELAAGLKLTVNATGDMGVTEATVKNIDGNAVLDVTLENNTLEIQQRVSK